MADCENSVIIADNYKVLNNIQKKSVIASLKVSVGIPTYNRPNGLRRTLACICGQTHHNIEIIISDNGSQGEETANVVSEFSSTDHRIIYYRQDRNYGVHYNFKEVLRYASGDYFMWAADDDEWNPEFIEICLEKLLETGADTAMTNFKVCNRVHLTLQEGKIPVLTPKNSTYTNCVNYLLMVTPSIIYGVNRRASLQYILEDSFFDYYDCYFALRQLLAGSGIITIDGYYYVAGIDQPDYVVKPAKEQSGKKLEYLPFLRKTIGLILRSEKLLLSEKLDLCRITIRNALGWFSHHEKEYYRFRTILAAWVSKKI